MTDVSFPWRMMDANLNRVAEGLRVVEDFVRFDWEDREICARIRALRHRIRAAFRTVYPQLVAQRNVATDPGVKVSLVQEGLDRKESKDDLLLANLKRVQEGLRVLEEGAHFLDNNKLAKELESLRFASYDLEALLVSPGQKNIQEKLLDHTPQKLPSGIYALTSEPHSLGRSNIEVAGEILDAGVMILQYREKTKKSKEMYQECLVIREMTQKAGALFIVNDHIDIALTVGADGVHIGQDDLPLPQVRALVGSSMMIGVSTHSPDQAWAAVAEGADYIGVGPIYATRTKADVCEPVGLEYLQYVQAHIPIPYVAIGGIKEHNLTEVVRVGARTVALVTDIVGSSEIGDKIHRLQETLNQ